MEREKKVRQSRGGATTGPDAKACVPTASRIHNNTAALDPTRAAPTESFSSPERTVTEAEILVGTALWIDRVRDWLADRLDLAAIVGGAPTATVTLQRADLEVFRSGLGQAVALLDRLTVDPAQLPPPTEPDVAPAATTGRTVH